MSLRSCQTAYGPCKFYGKDEYIGRSLYAYGEFSGLECEKLISLAGGLNIDVGANIGFMSMAMSTVGRTVAFEPQPELFKLLKENFNGECYNMALSRTDGATIMPRIRYGERGNYGGVPIGVRGDLGSIAVEMRTLDSFGFSGVSLIKIDVEGHELQVLQGAVETIKRDKPILYVEDDRPEKSRDLREFIYKQLGYDIEEHNPAMFRENNFAGNPKNIWGIDYVSQNIICRARN